MRVARSRNSWMYPLSEVETLIRRVKRRARGLKARHAGAVWGVIAFSGASVGGYRRDCDCQCASGGQQGGEGTGASGEKDLSGGHERSID